MSYEQKAQQTLENYGLKKRPRLTQASEASWSTQALPSAAHVWGSAAPPPTSAHQRRCWSSLRIYFFFSIVNHFWPEFKSFLIKKIGVNHPTRASLTFSVFQMLLDLPQPSNKVIKSIALQLGETADSIPRACYSGAADEGGESRRWEDGSLAWAVISGCHVTRQEKWHKSPFFF